MQAWILEAMRAPRFPLLLVVPAALFGCASVPDSCRNLVGVRPVLLHAANKAIIMDYVYADEPSRVRHLHCQADEGIQAAELELGRRYEMGTGVAQDLAWAASLYDKAARAVPKQTAIYSPPVKLGGSGQVMFLSNANARPGSAEAKYRLGLMYIEGRGVKMDMRHGQNLLKEAAAQGHKEAQQAVAALAL
jgi:hypothetical protein